MTKYKIDPDFVAPEPTAADIFCTLDDPGTPEARHDLIKGVFAEWRRKGIMQIRVTLTGPDIEGDETGYPAGLWLEGWKDWNARQLPFGTAEKPGGVIWPPLQAAPTPEDGKA